MPIEGRGRHLDPKQIPTRDRDIHLVELKFCWDINPQQTLEKRTININLLSSVYEQGASKASLETTVTLHVILLGVGGTIYNQYTITPLLNLGIPMHKVHHLTTKLHCHAIKSFNKIKKDKIQFNSVNRGLDGGITGREAALRGLCAGRIAWLTTHQIPINLCCFSFFDSW